MTHPTAGAGVVVTLALAVSLFNATPGAAQTPPANDDCLACHNDKSLTRSGNGSSVAVVPEVHAASVHAPLSCVDCHEDLAKTTEWPHPEKLQPANCATCHEEPMAAHQRSVHYELRAAAPPGRGATCRDCHGAHDIRSSSDESSRTYALNLPQTCAACHSGQHLIGPAGRAAEDYADSVHGRALRGRGMLVAANCSSCHGAHGIRRKTEPESPVHRTRVTETCATCHADVHAVYATSIHGQAVARDNTGAAVCSDCHAPHRLQPTESDRWRLAVIEQCGSCHVERISTYRDTFHGQVTALGFNQTASCASCHGSHDILPAAHPASTIAPQNLTRTCGQCHTGASESFVQYSPHADKHDREGDPALYWSYRFMQALLAGVFLFFGAHTVLWFPRSYRARRERAQLAVSPPTTVAPASRATAEPPADSGENRS